MDLPTAPSGPPGRPTGEGSTASLNGNNGGRGHNLNPISPSPPPPAPARGDPSKPRRNALKANERPLIPLSNLCSIGRYYAAADKVMDQFKAHLANGELDDAYVIGRRFALFSTVSLPDHDYYTSPKEELVSLRHKNQKDAQWVTRGLERIVEVMDKQEIEKQKAEEERTRKQKEEEERNRLEWEESMRQRLTGADLEPSAPVDDSAPLDIFSKLQKLNALFPKDDHVVEDEVAIPSAPPSAPTVEESQPLPPPIAPPLLGEQDMALLNSMSATQQLKSHGATPFFPEPPNYSDLFLDTLRTPSAPIASAEELAELGHLPSSIEPIPKTSPRMPIRVLKRNYERQMMSLHNSKHIEIIKLGTFQGRLSASNPRFDSTNGCAVISPLVVATHIYPQHMHRLNNQKKFSMTSATSSQYGISNSDINEIIDKRCPPMLETVRSKLGLNKHALIIPSDVHDYLVDELILPQDKFVGVCGGDIMEKDHIDELVTMLVNGNEKSDKKSKSCRKQKVGAALFFREHVISILKIPLGNGACYYDLVDSLPCPRAGGMASRTRCKDLASFEALLRWYASSKFSESHCDFIDDNEWNDGMCDFDPRTFQGFVWCETAR